jgi:hypothetical protein
MSLGGDIQVRSIQTIRKIETIKQHPIIGCCFEGYTI